MFMLAGNRKNSKQGAGKSKSRSQNTCHQDHKGKLPLSTRASYPGGNTPPHPRSHFVAALEKAVKAAHRSDRVYLIYLDIDRFEAFNNGFGHAAGDAILDAIRNRLYHHLDKYDELCELGGDKYAVICLTKRGEKRVESLVSRFTECVSDSILVRGKQVCLTASAGIVEVKSDEKSPFEWLQRAELALYRAKSSGGNRFCIYSPVMDYRCTKQLSFESDLKNALARDEFQLLYQPQVHIPSGEIVGAEALLRWNHPKYGAIGPGKFVGILESTRLIVSVGDWVLINACHQAKCWEQEGLGKLRVAINVSPYQLEDPNFVIRVQSALNDANLSPDRLDIEITEGVMVLSDPTKIETIHRLKALGTRITVDDFGVGYSSLAYLRQLPADALKLDRSFMRRIPEDPIDTTIARTIIQLAEDLDLSVVAEAVERPEQLGFLQNWPEVLVQGFYYFRPMVGDQLAGKRVPAR